jgi:hypothetical protein
VGEKNWREYSGLKKFKNMWLSHQQQNYKKKEHIMKNNEIYNKWTEFLNDNNYKKYFKKSKI